jgi:two-component system response regulator DctR
MQPSHDAMVFIVDDDGGVRDGLAWLLRSRHLPSRCFDSAESFDAMLHGGLPRAQPCCLLLDVRMPGMSGLALFESLAERGLTLWIPVIFLTGPADLPTAVAMVKRGAFDFCEKPVSDNALVDRVEQAIAHSAQQLALVDRRASVTRRLAELTERERSVMRLVVDGLPNKLVADQLDISVRTVEVHRARVFDKMEVKSAVELSRLLQQL